MGIYEAMETSEKKRENRKLNTKYKKYIGKERMLKKRKRRESKEILISTLITLYKCNSKLQFCSN
jgi:hypothetical protein